MTIRRTVTSADGTPIAYERTGDGPPLVLVHGGAAGSHLDWQPVVPRLGEQFTVYAMDRRGRGESGDSTDYAMEREFEDVAGVIDSIDEPASVVGHSLGALYSLEAALRTRNVDRLLLYEPAVSRGGAEVIPETVLDRIDHQIAEKDIEGALTTLLREAGYTDEELELLRSKPWWPVGVGAADTITRELRVLNEYRFDPDRFAEFSVPTALLTGSESPSLFSDTVKRLHEALPNSRIITIPGQAHEAMTTAPDLFVEKVVEFVREPDPSSSETQQ